MANRIMVLLAVLSAALPVGIMWFLHKRGGRWQAFLVGAAIFPLFAMGLEPVVHNLVLNSPIGAAVQENIWLYALYGGLAAGVFEETGRLAAFKLVLRERQERITALCYGIGHGGMEAFLVLGLTMISNLLLLSAARSGGQMPPEIAAMAEQLAATPTGMFLWAGLERIAAITLHLANSVLVFAAVNQPGSRWLYPAAILSHALGNFLAVVLNAKAGAAAAELATLAFAAALAVLVAQIYKKLPKNTENT